MLKLFILPLLFAASATSATLAGRSTSTWSVSNFNSLVSFGDSYTDENRLNYFGLNNGSTPPAGTFLPESFSTPGGGRTWPRYVIQYTGATVNGEWDPSMTLYDYAVSGAVCSNLITPRFLSAIHGDFPSVLEYAVPAFLADKSTLRNGTSTPYFTPPLTAHDAVYSLWIGTNDLGVNAFLTDSQVPGKTLTDYTDCIYQVLDDLYASGGRFFVLMNAAPLNLVPLYANDTIDGAVDSHYWPDKPSNHTAIAERMHEFVTSVNNIFKYQTPFEVLVANRYPDAEFALFDTWKLLSTFYDNPTVYLNGTAPANVTGFDYHCSANGTDCVKEDGGMSSDSFLWYDELHPSEQTDRNIAKAFIDVLDGKSEYASYYSSK